MQTCIVHQIRTSIKYIASKDKKAFMKDLKSIQGYYRRTCVSAAR